MKPIIAITVDCIHDPNDARTRGKLTLNWNYAEAVVEAGGVPILIPPTADMAAIAEIVHGWLIPGGNDIDAARFGEENHPKVVLQDPARYEAEAMLLGAVNPDLPVLGICYGCQFLNVARGGSLIQHLPDVVGHEEHTGGTLQSYALKPGSKLSRLLQTSQVQGRSYHHQAVKSLGHDLQVVAHGEDGTVEAIEAVDRPYLVGVQWHPERTMEDEATRRLFRSFVAAAEAYRGNKCAGMSMATSAI